MVLADLGADVVRVDRIRRGVGPQGEPGPAGHDVLTRSRRSVSIDLKDQRGAEVVLALVEQVDVLLEGFRPGVAERLGVGPSACLARNPQLIYGRMTGWGQEGPWARMAGHDIDYVALSGALHPIGPADRPPVVPLNYIADFGGGGMLMAVGVLAALVERQRSGEGQVIDAAMVDGAALLSSMFHGLRSMGLWTDARGSNALDGSAPYYRTYATADGGFLAVGALEPQFYAQLLAVVGLDEADWPQHDRSRWPALAERLTEVFAGRTRAEWAAAFEGTDACGAPLLGLAEAPAHPHLAARRTFVDVAGVMQPAPAPRFSRTPPSDPRPPRRSGADTDEVLAAARLTPARIAELRAAGVVD
jgi:alpha-methylacyl-CoA racemase